MENAIATESFSLRTLARESSASEAPLVVIRLKTSYWSDKRGLHVRRDLLFMRRLCVGHNWVAEDAAMAGEEEVIPRIVNLDECEDGLYYVTMVNEYRDWESNCIEDYDYKLVPLHLEELTEETANPESKAS